VKRKMIKIAEFNIDEAKCSAVETTANDTNYNEFYTPSIKHIIIMFSRNKGKMKMKSELIRRMAKAKNG